MKKMKKIAILSVVLVAAVGSSAFAAQRAMDYLGRFSCVQSCRSYARSLAYDAYEYYPSCGSCYGIDY